MGGRHGCISMRAFLIRLLNNFNLMVYPILQNDTKGVCKTPFALYIYLLLNEHHTFSLNIIT